MTLLKKIKIEKITDEKIIVFSYTKFD